MINKCDMERQKCVVGASFRAIDTSLADIHRVDTIVFESMFNVEIFDILFYRIMSTGCFSARNEFLY